MDPCVLIISDLLLIKIWICWIRLGDEQSHPFCNPHRFNLLRELINSCGMFGIHCLEKDFWNHIGEFREHYQQSLGVTVFILSGYQFSPWKVSFDEYFVGFIGKINIYIYFYSKLFPISLKEKKKKLHGVMAKDLRHGSQVLYMSIIIWVKDFWIGVLAFTNGSIHDHLEEGENLHLTRVI